MRSQLGSEANEKVDGKKNKQVNGFEVFMRLRKYCSRGSKIYMLER